jgi:hypothetical protein
VTDDVQRLAAFYARLVASTTAAGLAGEAVHRQVVAGVLGSGLGQGLQGADGGDDRAGPGGPGGWLVVVGEQDGREPGLHMAGDVVRDHAQEHVGADAVFGAVPDGRMSRSVLKATGVSQFWGGLRLCGGGVRRLIWG